MALKTLGELTVGNTVRLMEGTKWVSFIIVHKGKPDTFYDDSCDGIWLMRSDLYESRAWHTGSGNNYAKSDIHSWLNSTYLNLFSANLRSCIKTVKIPYTGGVGESTTGYSGSNGLSCKVFLASSPEVGGGWYRFKDGVRLDWFLNTDSVDDRKWLASINGNGSYVPWWTRSPGLDSTKSYAISNGGCGEYPCTRNHGIRPFMIFPSTLSVTDSGYINFAPSTPGSITVPETVSGGTTITVSWTASTDAEGNLEGYKVERSTNGGSSWTQIYQGSALSTTNSVAFGTASVMYRVKACDSEGLESGWRTSAQRTVLNNRAPTAPGSITVPEAVYGGGPLTVSWTASTDSDGNLSGYALERQADGGDWTEIYRGPALTCTDSVTRGWQSVAYRVRAYDSDSAYSGYTASETRAVNNNYAPVIASETASGTDLGEKEEGFALSYQVTDADGDAVTVREYLDETLQRSYEVVLNGENTFQAVDPQHWQTVLNGPHALKIIASDGKTDSPPYTVTFAKAVHAASVTLAAPMEADAEITVCALSVTGSIPADAAFKVEVTNNALDGEPVWEDCTAAVRNGVNHIFENRTAAGGFAFNFRLAVERGPGGQGGYITSIQGGFQ